MKVLTINIKNAVIITLTIIAIITALIVVMFGNNGTHNEKIPEIEIVLP